MSTPIAVEYDGRFRVVYRVGDDESAIRVLPEFGRLIAQAPAMRAWMTELLSHNPLVPGTVDMPTLAAARAILQAIDG